MGKKQKAADHENLERWLVSYADFITLLFATFVVLYALSQADLAKFKDFAQSVRQAFNPAKSVMENPGGVMKGTPEAQILTDSGNSILDKVMPKVPENAQVEGTIKPILEEIKKINKEITQANEKITGQNNKDEKTNLAELKIQERGIVISFASSLFFEPGSAGLKPESFYALDKIAKTLKDTGRIIHVEGHTDNIPISTAIYPSNWELSTARASSVVRYFSQKHKFDSKTLAAVGYAESRPTASNNTDEGRRKNRRIDIVILFSSAVKQADAGLSSQGEKIIIKSNEEGEGVGQPDEESTQNLSLPQEELLNPPITPISIKPTIPDILRKESVSSKNNHNVEQQE